MEVKITHLDKVKFAIHSRSHSIVCDQPSENGGEDGGMTPPSFCPRPWALVLHFMRCNISRRAVWTIGAWKFP